MSETVEGQQNEAGSSHSSAPNRANSLVFREAVAVLAVFLSMAGQAISMAVLVFSGSLEAGLPRAISAFVIAGGLVGAYLALTSGVVPAGSVIQDGPAIVMVAVAASVVARGGPDPLANVFVLLAVTSALTGMAMWLLGRFRLGALVRYMPTTVVGAFMAGTGWLLVKGGLDVAVGFPVRAGDIGDLFTADLAKFWVPGVALGALIWLIGRSDRLPRSAVSILIILALGGFYIVVLMASSVPAVESGGWLIGPFPSGAGPSIVTGRSLSDAEWRNILPEFPGIVSVVAVSIMVVLLNVTALGSRSSTRFDVNVELRQAGIANVVCAPLAVTPGFHGLAVTTLINQLGARRRIVPLAAGAFMVAFGVIGVSIIGFVPRLVVGAMLITVGLTLLAEWIAGMVRSVSKIEQLLSIAIVLVIGMVGILEGIAVGVIAVSAVFIVRYSRVDPIRLASSGHDVRSRVERRPDEVAVLRGRAERLAVFHLQGYLFFGSITSIEDRILALTDERDGGAFDAVVFDFSAVTGIDTSGYDLIGQMVQHLTSEGAHIVMSAVDRDLRDALVTAEPVSLSEVTWAASLDEALEATELVQLQLAGFDSGDPDVESIELSTALIDVFERRVFESGQVVIEQGSKSDGMFIVLDGTMTALQVDATGKRQRLRRFGRAATVGEIGLILGVARTAEIVAESDSEVLWLSETRYHELRTLRPELAFELHEYIVRRQAVQVASLSESLARSSR